MATKRVSKKNRYISELIYDIQHFTESIKEAKPFSETGKFPWIWYHGDRFTITQAKARIKENQEELDRINNDPSYTPWKDEPIEEPEFGPGDGVVYSIVKDREEKMIPVDGKPIPAEDFYQAMREASAKVYPKHKPFPEFPRTKPSHIK